MLNHQRELSLPRFTAAPTATSSAFFNTPVSVAAGRRAEGRASLRRRSEAAAVRPTAPRCAFRARSSLLDRADTLQYRRPPRPAEECYLVSILNRAGFCTGVFG